MSTKQWAIRLLAKIPIFLVDSQGISLGAHRDGESHLGRNLCCFCVDAHGVSPVGKLHDFTVSICCTATCQRIRTLSVPESEPEREELLRTGKARDKRISCVAIAHIVLAKPQEPTYLSLGPEEHTYIFDVQVGPVGAGDVEEGLHAHC